LVTVTVDVRGLATVRRHTEEVTSRLALVRNMLLQNTMAGSN